MASFVEKLECSSHPMDIAFHPSRENILASALVDGALEIHDIESSNEEDDEEIETMLAYLSIHTAQVSSSKSDRPMQASCRSVRFSRDGSSIFTGGSEGDLVGLDAPRCCSVSTSTDTSDRILWHIEGASQGKKTPFHVVETFSQTSLLATGDESGGVRLWDTRLCCNSSDSAEKPSGCVFSWKEHDDYISAFDMNIDGTTLLASSADGRLGVYDLRGGQQTKSGTTPSFRLSDDLEDELLSVRVIKNGKKVVCGTGEGVLGVFSYGTWGDISDRMPGHPSSIEALLKLDEDTLITGASDGLIRVVQIQPDKLIGVIGKGHEGFPVERLQFNATHKIIASTSHDCFVRLTDASILDENPQSADEDSASAESEDGSDKDDPKDANGRDSDDGWEDNEDGDSDSDSDDDEGSAPETANQQRSKRLKTDNEKFFEDI